MRRRARAQRTDTDCTAEQGQVTTRERRKSRARPAASTSRCPLRRRTALLGRLLLAVLGDSDARARLQALEERGPVPEREKDLEPDEEDGEDDALQERVEEGGRTALELREGVSGKLVEESGGREEDARRRDR